MYISVLDYLPLWVLFALTIILSMVCIEFGFRLGRLGKNRAIGEQSEPIGVMVGATFALLAFVLAFTFNMAASRYDLRRQLVLDEANAVGTTFIRAELLPTPYRDEIKDLLREYVNIRIEAVSHPEKLTTNLLRSEELHRLLWKQAVAVTEQYPGLTNNLFIESLNTVIDLHSKRITAGMRERIPGTIWISIYLVACLAMMAIGYHSGISGSNRSVVVIFQALAFAAILVLIADLDRPQEGLLKVGQQAMIDLQNTMKMSWR
jgi:hypothetical protein